MEGMLAAFAPGANRPSPSVAEDGPASPGHVTWGRQVGCSPAGPDCLDSGTEASPRLGGGRGHLPGAPDDDRLRDPGLGL